MTDAQTPTVDWFERTFEEIKNWGRWGADDQRGALNLLTPQSRVLNYVTSRRIVRTTPAASGTATQKRTEIEICGT